MGGGYIVMLIGKLLDHSAHVVIDGVPHYNVQAYNHVMWIMLVFFVLALVMACLLKETYCRQQLLLAKGWVNRL